MSSPLAGRIIALAEGRQVEELACLFEAEGATALRCPLLSIRDAPDGAAVVAWLRDLCADRFGWVILMTGEGLRRLLAAADKAGLRDRVPLALARARTLTRGPKPAQALKEVGVTPTRAAAAPTTAGVIAALRGEPLAGAAVGVTLAGGPNPPLLDFLTAAGAETHPVLAYVYAPAADGESVAGLIERLAGGTVDALVFTSSPQVDRLFEVATARGLEETLRRGLGRTVIAAVGPVVADSLARRGTPAQVVPPQGFVMKNLVRQVSRALAHG